MYLVILCTGSYDDYCENPHFITEDKQLAEDWVERYNSIIRDNKERINKFDIYDDSKETPYWYDLISYYDPIAIVKEVELRIK